MADGGGQGVPREVPSVALDRLFLELHDQLPKESRERFAKLADEVKRLTESSTVEAPVTPPSSAHQAVVRREEGMATTEAKQTSVELQARGAVVTSLSDQPTLRDVVCFTVPRVAPKWYDLGLALDVKPFVLDTIFQEQKCPDQPRTMFVKWLEGSPGTGSQPRTWQSVLDAVGMICGSAAVEDIRTAVQTPRIPTASDLEQSKTTQHSSEIELSRKRHRSSTRSSDDIALQQSVAKKCFHDYTDLKMDLLAQDILDLHSKSDPCFIIRLLYSNFLIRIAKLLTPHFSEVKIAADNHCQLGLHPTAVAEGAIGSAESLDNLFNLMSVKKMWDNTCFFRKAVAAIPASAPERQAAEGILLHYNTHLAIFKKATLLRDALARETKIDEKKTGSNEDDKLIPLKITSVKPIDGFTSEDCYRIQARLLSTAYGIPHEKIICQDADESHSTTVTFNVPSQYMHNIVQCSMQLPKVWVLLELDIIEVSIPGVFTFIPSVGCFLSLLRGSKPFTADLLGVTEVLPYQTYCLLDPDTKEPLSGRPLSTKRIEQHWDSHGGLVPDPHGSVPESGDTEILATHSEEAVIPPEGSNVSTTDEWQSKVGELEDKVKDLERKVANLFMDNVALKTKLEASREVERQQQEEIARLEERLVQALRAQDTATQELSLLRTRESELEEEIKVLEETRSDFEGEDEKLEKQMKQLEILPSDVEQLAKQVATKEAECRQADESNREKDEVIREKSATIRAQQAEIQRLRDQLAVSQKLKPPLRDWRKLGKCQKVIQHSPGGGWYSGVAVNSEGLLAVIDGKDQCIHLLQKEGALVRSIGKGMLGYLCGVTFDLKGNVAVADWDNNKVLKLSQDDCLLQTIDHAGSKSDHFNHPDVVSVSPEGLVYICDRDNHRVTVHDEKGMFLFAFGSQGCGPGCISRPRDVTFGPDGLVYVTDVGNSRVGVWSKEGCFQRDFKTKYIPTFIAATGDNHLLITSWSSNIVMVYTLGGQLVHEFGGRDSDPGRFRGPYGICVDDSGAVYVTDYFNGRVQVF